MSPKLLAPKKSVSELASDNRGAALVEFVIAVVPMLMTFFGFVQVAKIYTASLVVQHGAIAAARAAMVISKANDNNPGENGEISEAKQAAAVAMLPWVQDGSITNVDVQMTDESSKSDPYGPVTVNMTASYRCGVPMMGRIICTGGRKTITARTVKMPHQGANYKESQ